MEWAVGGEKGGNEEEDSPALQGPLRSPPDGATAGAARSDAFAACAEEEGGRPSEARSRAGTFAAEEPIVGAGAVAPLNGPNAAGREGEGDGGGEEGLEWKGRGRRRVVTVE
jgi:hypothetical protein